jgi:hypothetical protein
MKATKQSLKYCRLYENGSDLEMPQQAGNWLESKQWIYRRGNAGIEKPFTGNQLKTAIPAMMWRQRTVVVMGMGTK